jgi:2-methylcitrate dehydratase
LASVTGQEIDLSPLRATGGPAILSCHIKRFPSGYFSQGAIEAALAARAELDGRIPAAVEVGTFEFGKRVMAGDAQKWHPATRETADHSLPYVVACALARGAVRRDDLAESELGDSRIGRLLDILTVEEDPECVAAWPEACMNRITVRLADGAQVSRSVRYYRGHAKNPMSDAELEAKFREQAESVITADDADALLAAAWALDEARSARALFAWAPIGSER